MSGRDFLAACPHPGAAGSCMPRLSDGRCIWCERPLPAVGEWIGRAPAAAVRLVFEAGYAAGSLDGDHDGLEEAWRDFLEQLGYVPRRAEVHP